jgi:hypothetical protein
MLLLSVLLSGLGFEVEWMRGVSSGLCEMPRDMASMGHNTSWRPLRDV